MRVSELYGKEPFAGESVFIIGSGPSLTVFPEDYLMDEFCILLNDTWQYRQSLGPVAFSNNRKFLANCELQYQIAKARLKFQPNMELDDNHVRWPDDKYYCFSYRDKRYDEWDHFDDKALWNEPDHYWNMPGGNSSIFCMQFCLLAGVKKITLVGCDCCKIESNYLDGKKHRSANHNYDAYASGTMRMIREAEERFGVPIVQMNPFAGIGRESDQLKEMKTWK